MSKVKSHEDFRKIDYDLVVQGGQIAKESNV